MWTYTGMLETAVTLMNTVNVPRMVRDAMAVENWDTLAGAVNKGKVLPLVAKDQEKIW